MKEEEREKSILRKRKGTGEIRKIEEKLLSLKWTQKRIREELKTRRKMSESEITKLINAAIVQLMAVIMS